MKQEYCNYWNAAPRAMYHKRDPWIFNCNLRKHCTTLIIFGRNVTYKLDDISLTWCLCITWQNRKHGNHIFFWILHVVLRKNTKKHIEINTHYSQTTPALICSFFGIVSYFFLKVFASYVQILLSTVNGMQLAVELSSY